MGLLLGDSKPESFVDVMGFSHSSSTLDRIMFSHPRRSDKTVIGAIALCWPVQCNFSLHELGC